MGVDMFFDKICTIYENGVQLINQTQVATKNILYDKIPCDFGKGVVNTRNFAEAIPTQSYDDEKFDLVLNGPGYSDLRKGIYVEVFDSLDTLKSQGVYKIVSIDFVKDLYGDVDNVYIGLNAIDGATY